MSKRKREAEPKSKPRETKSEAERESGLDELRRLMNMLELDNQCDEADKKADNEVARTLGTKETKLRDLMIKFRF